MMRCNRPLVAIAIAACLAVTAATARAAPGDSPGDPKDLALGYRVYFGGFEALALGVDVALAAERYKMDMNFRTQGLIGRLFPWTMRAFARGRLALLRAFQKRPRLMRALVRLFGKRLHRVERRLEAIDSELFREKKRYLFYRFAGPA